MGEALAAGRPWPGDGPAPRAAYAGPRVEGAVLAPPPELYRGGHSIAALAEFIAGASDKTTVVLEGDDARVRELVRGSRYAVVGGGPSGKSLLALLVAAASVDLGSCIIAPMTFDEIASNHKTDVECMATRVLAGRGGPVTRDDLVQAGLVGLWQAATRYDKACGTTLWEYAKDRVRGAMVDELRVQSYRSRLAQEAWREDTWHVKTPWANVVSVPLSVAENLPGGTTGHEALEAAERARLVREALARIPVRTAEVVELVYFKDQAVKDVAEEIGVTPSRVCQVLGEGLRLLRAALTPAEVAGLTEARASVPSTMRGRGSSRARTICYQGKDLPLAQWASLLGLPRGTLLGRLRRGWSVRKAVETPLLAALSRPKRRAPTQKNEESP